MISMHLDSRQFWETLSKVIAKVPLHASLILSLLSGFIYKILVENSEISFFK